MNKLLLLLVLCGSFGWASEKNIWHKCNIYDIQKTSVSHEVIAEVFQSKMAFTNDNDPKYFFATYGCIPSVVVASYDKNSNLYNISKLSEKNLLKGLDQLHLCGGIAGQFEKAIIAIEVLKSDARQGLKAEAFKDVIRIIQQTSVPQTAIAEAFQSEMAFTNASDPRHVLATYGCRPCVAMAGYDPTNKSAFIAHFANAAEVEENGRTLFYNISKLSRETLKTPIKLHLRGGEEGRQSEDTIIAIKAWMKKRPDLPMTIASTDVLGNPRKPRSLLIDAKTGAVGEYDSKLNPDRREFTKIEETLLLMNTYLRNHSMEVAYSAKNLSQNS